jgi:hypothetical protein
MLRLPLMRRSAVDSSWTVISALAVLAMVVLAVWLRGSVGRQSARRQSAIERFHTRRPTLEAAFLAAANATGKPRGLRWVACQFDPGVLFAAERPSGNLCALVGATVSFEAIEGGGMEEVEAVGNLRYATAVFVHRGGAWTTDGRAVFNLEPAQAIERFGERLTAFQSNE